MKSKTIGSSVLFSGILASTLFAPANAQTDVAAMPLPWAGKILEVTCMLGEGQTIHTVTADESKVDYSVRAGNFAGGHDSSRSVLDLKSHIVYHPAYFDMVGTEPSEHKKYAGSLESLIARIEKALGQDEKVPCRPVYVKGSRDDAASVLAYLEALRKTAEAAEKSVQ